MMKQSLRPQEPEAWFKNPVALQVLLALIALASFVILVLTFVVLINK